MMNISRLLLDTDIWVDYFLGAGPSLEAIKRLIALGVEGRVTLFYAPTSAKDTFYLLPRRLKAQDANGGRDVESYSAVAWACLERMMELATAAPQSHAECELARLFRATFGDFEDNLIIAAGETVKADYIVTNDKVFLRALPEACVTPERAVELLSFSR